MLAMTGLFDFAGTLASSGLSDRFDNRWLLFCYYGLRGLSLLCLPFSDFSFYSLSIFVIFYGLDGAATGPPTMKLTAQRFGPEQTNIMFGWIFAGHQLGAASVALGGGRRPVPRAPAQLYADLHRRGLAVPDRFGAGAVDQPGTHGISCSRVTGAATLMG